MAWVVDTCVVLDLVTGDPQFEAASTSCLHAHLPDGLVVSPVTFIEIGPAFEGDATAAESFLKQIHLSSTEFWSSEDTKLAHRYWHEHQLRRRQSSVAKRPVADVMIAAFADRFQGIITRNASDFRNIAPSIVVIVP
ncbi:MAG: type II toxin-antitoxin system VapC family toxin [Prosthecobacter sp.]|uniref:type II toxin-antitoxin system VapC family toxin n=1 Tax=Prosthecobacter sp. TaxID=1965333 RepID=UPI0039024FE1